MDAGLYVHIPFCRAKCAYCDFVSSANCESSFTPTCKRWNRRPPCGRLAWAEARFDTLYLGGGTPTVLPPLALAHLLEVPARAIPRGRGRRDHAGSQPRHRRPVTLRALQRGALTAQPRLPEPGRDRTGTIRPYPYPPEEALAAWRHARAGGFRT